MYIKMNYIIIYSDSMDKSQLNGLHAMGESR